MIKKLAKYGKVREQTKIQFSCGELRALIINFRRQIYQEADLLDLYRGQNLLTQVATDAVTKSHTHYLQHYCLRGDRRRVVEVWVVVSRGRSRLHEEALEKFPFMASAWATWEVVVV